ncbi:hypothetical protein ACKWTF_014445 [Chironomus riparius]
MKFLQLPALLCLINLKPTIANSKNHQICRSAECYSQSNSILTNMDTSVSPCDDFYQFACGNYQSSPSIDFVAIIEKIISKKKVKKDQKHMTLAKQYHQKCMHDQDSVDEHVVDVIKSIGWPFGDKSVELSLVNFINNFQTFDFLNSFFFNLELNRNVKNQRMLMIYHASNVFKLQNSTERLIEAEITKLERIFGTSKQELRKVMTEVFDFSDEFGEILGSSKNDVTSKNMTLKVLQNKIFSMLDWNQYLNNIFDGSFKAAEVFIENVEKLTKINKMLLITPPHVIKNFIAYSFFNQIHSDKAEVSVKSDDDELTSLNRKSADFWTRRSPHPQVNTKNSSLSRKCTVKLMKTLMPASSAIFGQHFLTKSLKTELNQMIDIIKREIIKNFRSTSWLDKKTISKAVEKVKKMKFVRGYPKEFDEPKFFENYYKNLNFGGKSYFRILKSINLNRKARFIEEFLNPMKIHELEEMELQSWFLNAFNDFESNKIHLNAALMQSMNFSSTLPKFWNYGTFGSVIGHEIMHGFDNYGRTYDYKGDKVNWWGKKADQEFVNRSKCFIDQYGNYTEPITGLNVNGTLTLGENIADNGGYTLAYKAWSKINIVDQTLPNLKFSPKQLFWISNAQSFCSKLDAEKILDSLKHDPHSPGIFRINGAFGNSDDFLNDFQCPKGSGMNRKDKCKVW